MILPIDSLTVQVENLSWVKRVYSGSNHEKMNETRMIAKRGINVKRTHLIAGIIGVIAIGMSTTDASAMFHPGIGGFMQRDPGTAISTGTPRVGTAGPAIGGRFIPRDQYAAGTNLYQYCNSNPVIRVDPQGRKDYKIGKGAKPTIKWDNGYPYDPKAEPNWRDYWHWTKYEALLEGAEMLGHLPDGTRAYRHYRDGTGTDLAVDYDKAIRDDGAISNGFKAELAGAQADIEREHDGKTQQFTVYSTKARLVGSDTENWQKALGDHDIWGTGDVTYDPSKCQYTLTITVEMEDFYNFNKGQADIASGLPDDENGRFEVFGWAKSFYSRGKVTRIITWKRGEADKTTQINGEPRRGVPRR